jgi:hypothetical protein
MQGSGFPQCLPDPNLSTELPGEIVSDIPTNWEPTRKGAVSIRSSVTWNLSSVDEQMVITPLIQVLPFGFLPTNCNPLPGPALIVKKSGWLSF